MADIMKITDKVDAAKDALEPLLGKGATDVIGIPVNAMIKAAQECRYEDILSLMRELGEDAQFTKLAKGKKAREAAEEKYAELGEAVNDAVVTLLIDGCGCRKEG